MDDMRKALLMAPLFVAFLALMSAIPVKAVTLTFPGKAVTITVETVDAEHHTPRDMFFPGETLCVHIHSSEDAEGYIVLFNDKVHPIPYTYKNLELTGCKDKYVEYTIPSEFPLETYYIFVKLKGCDPFWLSFTVIRFFVIPELPFGTLMAIVAPFGAVAGLVKTKRLQVIR